LLTNFLLKMGIGDGVNAKAKKHSNESNISVTNIGKLKHIYIVYFNFGDFNTYL
jgi:hypothetical protein